MWAMISFNFYLNGNKVIILCFRNIVLVLNGWGICPPIYWSFIVRWKWPSYVNFCLHFTLCELVKDQSGGVSLELIPFMLYRLSDEDEKCVTGVFPLLSGVWCAKCVIHETLVQWLCWTTQDLGENGHLVQNYDKLSMFSLARVELLWESPIVHNRELHGRLNSWYCCLPLRVL